MELQLKKILEFLLQPEMLAVVISFVALWFSRKAWHKSRAVYGVEREVIRQFDGTHEDLYIRENKKLSEKLSSGNYTTLAFLERKKDKDWEVLLGRITPY